MFRLPFDFNRNASKSIEILRPIPRGFSVKNCKSFGAALPSNVLGNGQRKRGGLFRLMLTNTYTHRGNREKKKRVKERLGKDRYKDREREEKEKDMFVKTS